MKTIQEYLKTCNREEIINSFIYEHAFYPLHMMEKKNSDITIGERIEYVKSRLNKMIDTLIETKPIDEDGERWILLAHHRADDEYGDITYSLYKESELEGDGFKISYGYEFTPFEEAVGFYVADTYLTQYELHSLIVDFLHRISWTGYDQEHLQEEIDKITKSLKEVDEHSDDPDYFIPAEDAFEEIREEFGFELEKKDPKQEEAYKKLMQAQIEYNTLCQKIEIDKLKESLAKELSSY